MWNLIFTLLMVQFGNEPFTSPASPIPEYGYGLTAETAKAGWIALYDGQTTDGWIGATQVTASLCEGRTTTTFGKCDLKGEVVAGGDISVGDQMRHLAPGKFEHSFLVTRPGPIRLGSGLKLKALWLKPTGLQAVFNGRDLAGWTIVRHPKLSDSRQTAWSVIDGKLLGVGGPGAVELDGRFGDFVLQVEVCMRAKLVNGGVFFRAIPGQFMNGYEAQLYNGCYQRDPGRPGRYSTGAIDDRLLARRLASRDLEPFLMTVIAVGPQISTWVNGYQTVDWTDTRAPHDNPRVGLRLEAGTIQLQAHDPETDIEFRQVLISPVGKSSSGTAHQPHQ